MWDSHYYPDQTVTWTGGCSDGLVSGKGTSKWVRGSEGFEASGLYQNGKANGQWVQRGPDGLSAEGPVVDGKQHGQWVFRFARGRTETHTFVNGELQ